MGELPVIGRTGNLTHLAWRMGSRHFILRTGCAVTPDDKEYLSQVGEGLEWASGKRDRRFWIKRITTTCWAEPIKTSPRMKTSWSHNHHKATHVLDLPIGN